MKYVNILSKHLLYLLNLVFVREFSELGLPLYQEALVGFEQGSDFQPWQYIKGHYDAQGQMHKCPYAVSRAVRLLSYRRILFQYILTALSKRSNYIVHWVVLYDAQVG